MGSEEQSEENIYDMIDKFCQKIDEYISRDDVSDEEKHLGGLLENDLVSYLTYYDWGMKMTDDQYDRMMELLRQILRCLERIEGWLASLFVGNHFFPP